MLINLDFKQQLMKFYNECSVPLSEESGIRSVLHNKVVKNAAPMSLHVLGRAQDLIADSDADLAVAAKEADAFGFTGIEVDLRNMHLHVDNRTNGVWKVCILKDGSQIPLSEYLNQGGNHGAQEIPPPNAA